MVAMIIIIIIIIIHNRLPLHLPRLHHNRHLRDLLRHARREIIITQVGQKKTVGRHSILLLLWHRLLDIDRTFPSLPPME